ncbi:MAG TPA: VOC family protein [Vicinamibacterales bacterium]|nr:VOC family protein [Vicinamibacterales bacterium]
MAIHLDHVSISSPNMFYGAHRLRLETTLSFYDGGHVLNGDLANRIFPLGANTYLELNGIVDAHAMRDAKNRPWWYDGVQTLGECFTGLGFRVDTFDELQAIARKKGYTIAKDPTTRIWPNGYAMRVFSAPGPRESVANGFPMWHWFEDFPMHPSGQPPSTAPKITRPDGVAWIEVGGTAKEMYDWLDMPAGTLPFRFNGRPPGLYAIGVKTMRGGEIVIRRPSVTEY